jgi:hypothetical protein
MSTKTALTKSASAKARSVKRLGEFNSETADAELNTLGELFAL